MGERRLEVRFASRVAALPDSVKVGALDDSGLQFTFTERPDSRPAADVLSALITAGLPVADVNMVPSRLEEVMLRVLRGGVA